MLPRRTSLHLGTSCQERRAGRFRAQLIWLGLIGWCLMLAIVAGAVVATAWPGR